MKSLLIAIVSLVLVFPITAQTAEKDMKKAARNIGSYRLDPVTNADKLVEAEELMASAIKSPELAKSVKAWQTYGELHAEIINNEVRRLALDQTTPIVKKDAGAKSVKGYTTAYGLAEKKFEKNDALNGLSAILNNVSYEASLMLSNGTYADAYVLYEALIEGNDFLVANGEASVYPNEIEYNEQIYWAALAVLSEQNYTEAEKQFTRLYEANYDNPDIYSGLYEVKKALGDTTGAQAILSEGMARYPDDKSLMFAEINDALARGDLESLVSKLKTAIEAEPENVTIPTTLGNVYDQLYQKAVAAGDDELAMEYYENAKVYFALALSLDEESFDATYMMGAVEYNRAAELASELNLLAEDYSKDGTKLYDAKKIEMEAQFDKALPFFLKAESLKANDLNTVIALREIYARKGELEKSAAYKAKYDAIKAGN